MFQLLKKNDTVGLISPASFISKKNLENSILNLKTFGLNTFYYDSVLSKHKNFAGTDQERANELNKMYANKSVKAIMCVRGGYGTSKIANLINYDLIKQNPKPLIAYSDITFLHTAIYKKTKQIGIHGLVGASIFNDFTANNFKNFFFENKKQINYSLTKELKKDAFIINSGIAKGKLIGGNLAMLCSLLSTPFDVDWANRIIFIEEINEAPYKVDRMLTQLIQANKFKDVKGIIFGKFNKCKPSDFNIKTEDTFNIKEVLINLIKPLNVPAIYGFPFGHIENQIILAIGAKANFNANKMELTINKDFLNS